MGMAASQARLLSITSRMSDNELKSQLINNAKMRLTSESSKASEKYLAALNSTQLMFSNYNLQGESQYQQLNFNNLTAYSAYNNQYGLSNKGGEILVSELNSAKYEEAFKKAEADNSISPEDIDGKNAKALEEFLKSYGLVKDTTYFEKNDLYTIDPKIKEIYEGDMVFEYNTNGTDGNPQAIRLSGIHYGYEESHYTKDYGIYNSLVDNFTSAEKVYKAMTKQSMHNYVENLQTKDKTKTYTQTYKEVIEWANGLEYQTNDKGESKLVNPDSAVTKAEEYKNKMIDFYNQIKNDGKFKTSSNAFHDRMDFYFKLQFGEKYEDDNGIAYEREGLTNIPNLEGKIVINEEDFYDENGNEKYPYKTDEDGNKIPIKTALGEDVKEYILRDMTKEEFVDTIIDMYRFFQGEVLTQLSDDTFKSEYILGSDDEASAAEKFQKAQKNYYKSAQELSTFIFGHDVGANYYDKLTDMDWILYGDYIDPTQPELGRNNAPLFATTALDASEGGVVTQLNFPVAGSLEEGDLPYQANFQVIKDIYLCEKMMETFGTPNYTWIDLNNPDENAEKKAEWYTNLFNRMNQGGYQTIENGLASSSEWLQFALESGLITMEQVDVKKAWVSTMYSNCSNITESQVDVDITIAEAEYNKAMKDIEAKDKRYDIELKNIDTEHQSLQTEYESIKSVIDKNVERNFKMFQA